jgi:hypothetical protein
VLQLSDADAANVLYAGDGLQKQDLTKQQEEAVLQYCGGMPLALTVIRSFLENLDERHEVLCRIHNSLASKERVGVDSSDWLLDRLQLSIDLLQPATRTAWLDICVLFPDESWCYLEWVYGQQCMGKLLRQNLISKAELEGLEPILP